MRAYLRERGDLVEETLSAEVLDIQVLAGGVSNRTVLVTRPDGRAWVLKQALEKLRVATDWRSSPERVHVEAAGTRYLARCAPPGSICGFVFEDKKEHILAIEAVPQPHDNWKTLLLRGELSEEHVRQFAALLGTVHRVAAGDPAARATFGERGFFESLRLEPYYLYTAEHVPEAATFLRQLVTATRERRLTLVHGDYSPKNVLVHEKRLVLLDHEVIHWGDPAFDLGFALTHLLSKAHHLRAHRERFVRAALLFWMTYQETLGEITFEALERYAARHTLACLLARVAGRSPLEYLSAEARARQRSAVLRLITQEPESVPDLIHTFTEALDAEA